MKQRLACYALVCACILTASCVRRELTYDYRPWCNLRVNVDWSSFGQTPTGMTLIFFPEDGSAPLTFITTQTVSTTAELQAGRYDILVFNQSPQEFGTLEFRGMDRYETVEIVARERDSKGYFDQTEGEKTVHEPERVGIGRLEGFEVTREMVNQSMEQYAQKRTDETASITLHPECILSKASVRVKVKGIHNVRAVRGLMSGWAEGHWATQGKPNDGKVSHLLEDWQIVHDKTDYSFGEVVIAFNTFGLPAPSTLAQTNGGSGNNRLHLSFLLVDNKTVKEFAFDVSDRIEASEEEELALVVEIGTSLAGDRPEDKPVEIEDVKPENGSEGGFDATVDDWGDQTEIEIPIG